MSAATPLLKPEPIVTFYRMVPTAMPPMRADRSACGVIPAAALQYCEALTSASAFGWYAFAPMDFHVQFDGTDILWTHADAESWFPLSSTHFPGFEEEFDAKVPEDIRGYAPPFLTKVMQPGVLQIWTGLLVRSRPGYSLLVRPPANLPRSQDYEPYEGIIETDSWFYPLFTNVRLTATNKPIAFESARPLVQVQPILREAYREELLRATADVDGLEQFAAADWDDYRRTVVARGKNPFMRPGRYATDVRKRARTGGGPHGE